MSDKITVYQKPTCSKCRTTIAMLNDRGVEFDSVNYYETPLTSEELKTVLQKLGASPRDVIRKDEPIYRELNLGSRQPGDEELISLMVEHPDLIQRPIVVRGERAVLARPPHKVEELL